MVQLSSVAPNTTKRIVVSDAKSCDRWLAAAPLVDPRQACFELTSLLEALESNAPQPRHQIEVLERLRRPVLLAAEEHAKRFGGRPLPLPENESVSFDQVQDLLRAFNGAYRSLIRKIMTEGSSALTKRLATLCARSLECSGELLHLHYQCRREIPSEIWQALHEVYETAERASLATEPLTEVSSRKITCADFYARPLLLHLAAPYALNSRELEWTRRWARLWASKVEFVNTAPGSAHFSVNLAGDVAPQHSRREAAAPVAAEPSGSKALVPTNPKALAPTNPKAPAPGSPEAPNSATALALPSPIRYLQMSQLKRSVRKRLQGIEQGQTPESLGLGQDCNGAEATQLLAALRSQWFATPALRHFSRRAVSGRAELVSGFEPILLAIGGKIAKNDSHHWDFTRKNTDQFFIFGTSESASRDRIEQGVRPERWEMLEDSANGFRLRRHGSGARLQVHQLIALQPHGATAFMLCEIRWLQIGLDAHTITMGVQALPGLARPISVRPTPGSAYNEERFAPAFLLPANSTAEGSLVLSPGCFMPERLLDVSIDVEVRSVHLKTLIQSGYDFERVSFVTTPSRARSATRII